MSSGGMTAESSGLPRALRPFDRPETTLVAISLGAAEAESFLHTVVAADRQPGGLISELRCGGSAASSVPATISAICRAQGTYAKLTTTMTSTPSTTASTSSSSTVTYSSSSTSTTTSVTSTTPTAFDCFSHGFQGPIRNFTIKGSESFSRNTNIANAEACSVLCEAAPSCASFAFRRGTTVCKLGISASTAPVVANQNFDYCKFVFVFCERHTVNC